MSETIDVVVVGGGIAGASAAWGLTEYGLSVALVEQEAQLAHHTTGRSAAIYLESYGPAIVRQLTAASRADFESAEELLGSPPIFTPRQAMWLATDDQVDELDHLLSEISSLRKISAAEAIELCPVLRPDALVAGAIEDHSAEMDVLALHQGFVRTATRRGAKIQTVWRVVEIRRRGDGWLVRSEGGQDLTCNQVVVAAGSWCDQVAALAGATPLGLHPMRRTIAICPTKVELDPMGPLMHHVDESYYWKPEGPNILCSPADETPSEPCDARPEEQDVALVIDRVNETTTLAIRSVITTWAGLRTFTADRIPVCGEDLEVPGLWWLAGQGGYGIQTSPAMGRAIGSLIATGAMADQLQNVGLSADVLGPQRLAALDPSSIPARH
jgi:D-arginine dehydrogenase